MKTDYYLSNAEVTTPLAEYCRAAKAEHRVEECLQSAKGQAGMADYEVRNWIGWQHHQTLCLLANWFLTVETRRAEKKDTCNDVESNAVGNRFDTSNGVRMRFTPERQMANQATIASQSTSTPVSLETA